MTGEVVRPNFQRVELTLDVGQVPHGHKLGGKYVVTVQVAPLDTPGEANQIAVAIKEALESRLGIRFTVPINGGGQ